VEICGMRTVHQYFTYHRLTAAAGKRRSIFEACAGCSLAPGVLETTSMRITLNVRRNGAWSNAGAAVVRRDPGAALMA
jgi:hypothetical protein